MKMFAAALAALALSAAASPTEAAVLLDTGTPANSNSSYALNYGQWMGGRFELGSDAVITDIEAVLNISSAGSFRVTLYSDHAFAAKTVLYSASALSSGAGTQEWQGVHGVDWNLTAGAYWLAFEVDPGGMAGNIIGGAPDPLGIYGFKNVVEDQPWVMAGAIGTAFRVSGTGGGPITSPEFPSVPEPTTWAMLVIGFGVLGSAVRRARRPMALA